MTKAREAFRRQSKIYISAANYDPQRIIAVELINLKV